jgi:SAM-dependent methyltransferase
MQLSTSPSTGDAADEMRPATPNAMRDEQERSPGERGRLGRTVSAPAGWAGEPPTLPGGRAGDAPALPGRTAFLPETSAALALACGGAANEAARRPALKWRALSLVLRTLGQASAGIRLGYRHGFDSGPMLDYVYEDRARGCFWYGRLADRVYLDSIGWRAIRARKALLQIVLRAEIAANRAAGRPTALLDVAAGPGRYLQELAAELGTRGGLTIICRDLDEAGLAQGRARAAALGLGGMRYERGDACDATSLARVTPRPNLVVASGIYELLDAALVQRSMAGVYALLPTGGRFVFTTQVMHPQLEMIANVLPNRFGEPWVMECRTLADVEGYARAAGFRDLASRLEPHGLFAVTTGQK